MEPVDAPTETAAHVPWTLLDCAGVVLATGVLTFVLANVLGLIDAVVGLPGDAEVILLPLPLAVLAVVTVTWVQLRRRAAGALTGPSRGGPAEWAVGIGLGLAAFLVVNLVLGSVVELGAEQLGFDVPETQPGIRQGATDAESLPWVALSAIVVAPVAEELFFRGMLFQALRRRMGRWSAIAISALLFAAAHVLSEPTAAGGVLVFALVLPLGLLLAWVLERRGTLVTPIALHATFNGVTLALMLLLAGEGVMAWS